MHIHTNKKLLAKAQLLVANKPLEIELRQKRKRKVKVQAYTDWYLTEAKFYGKESLVLVQPDLKLYLPLAKDDDVLAKALSILPYMLNNTMVPDITINNYLDALYNGREIEFVVDEQAYQLPELKEPENSVYEDVFDTGLNLFERLKAIGSSGALISAFNNPNQTEFAVTLLSQTYPQRAKKPSRKFAYMDMEAKFQDFRTWQAVEFKPIQDISAVKKEIMANNVAVIAQFLETDLRLGLPDKIVGDLVKSYLNDYLLISDFRMATSNLSDLAMFVWEVIDGELQKDPYVALDGIEMVQEIFRKFYLFLTRTGMMTKADMKYVDQALENAVAWVEDELEIESSMLNETESGMLNDVEFNEILTELEGMPVEFREMLLQIMPPRAQKVFETELDRRKVHQDVNDKPYMKIRKK